MLPPIVDTSLATRAAALAIAVIVAGCGGPAPSASPADPVFGQPRAGPLVGGVRWTALVEPPGIESSRFHAVTVGPAGVLAVGMGENPNAARNPNGLAETLATWRSTDGVTWQGGPVLAGVAPDTVAEAYHTSAGPRGYVVAGSICCIAEHPAIWWSPDGLSWEAAELPAGAGPFSDIAAGPDGFVAAGDGPGLWTSADGLDWRTVPAETIALEAGTIAAVAWTGRSWLAVGSDDPGQDADGAAWVSPDLVDWVRVGVGDPAIGGVDEVSLMDLIPFAGGVFVAGGSGTQEDRDRCQNALQGGALVAGPEVAFSCVWLHETFWLTDDGTRFERLPPQPAIPPDGVVMAPRLVGWWPMAAGGPGLLVLGREVTQAGGPDTAALWQSSDGRTWLRVGADPAAFLEGDMVSGFIVAGDRFVAVGERWDGVGPAEPAVWLGIAG
jgi:hypothetical protein